MYYRYDALGRKCGCDVLSGSGVLSATSLTLDLQSRETARLVSDAAGVEHFSSELRYHDPHLSVSVPRYGGDISEWEWSRGTGSKCYSFRYDGLSRLTGSILSEDGRRTDRFSEPVVSYDLNGNILSLGRRSGSVLTTVRDSYFGNRKTDCRYDAVGRLTHDAASGVDLEWNRYGLVSRTSKSGASLVFYSWLPDGTKVSALDGDGSGLLYQGPFVYRCSGGVPVSLESVPFPGGRFVASASAGGSLVPLLYAEDHLGSVRAVVDGMTGEVVEISDYYPFGGRWADPESLTSDSNRYRYNGKEEQSSLYPASYGSQISYIDYGARQYAPATGRWLSPDPLAEKYYSISPYAFCNNNPVNFVDLDGRDWYEAGDGSVMWRAGNDKNYVDETGKEWKNIGQKYTYYLYDGSALYFYQQEVNGEQQLSSHLFSDEQMLVFDSYHSEIARDAAFEYYFNPTFSNALKLYAAELKAQWTDPYLLTGAIHIGVSNISSNPIKGFKEHGLHRAINRGFKPKVILNIVKEGNVTHAKGRYGRPQARYRLGNNVVILDEHGKIITVYGPRPTGNYQK